MNDTDTNEQTPSLTPKEKSQRRAKMIFGLVALLAMLGIWLMQRNAIPQTQWSRDLPSALQLAKARDTKVLVLFTAATITAGSDDAFALEMVINRPVTKTALEKLGYVCVQLDTQNNADEARRYDVTRTPTYLLLSADGTKLKSFTGKTNDVSFCTEFLGYSEK